MPPPEKICKSEIGNQPTMCQVHTGTYVSISLIRVRVGSTHGEKHKHNNIGHPTNCTWRNRPQTACHPENTTIGCEFDKFRSDAHLCKLCEREYTGRPFLESLVSRVKTRSIAVVDILELAMNHAHDILTCYWRRHDFFISKVQYEIENVTHE